MLRNASNIDCYKLETIIVDLKQKKRVRSVSAKCQNCENLDYLNQLRQNGSSRITFNSIYSLDLFLESVKLVSYSKLIKSMR